MNKLVTQFLDSVIDQKVEQLMGITLDITYWTKVIGGRDVDDLRKQLSAQQEKVIKSAKGQVIKDERDMELVDTLVQQIDQVEQAVKELTRLQQMESQIRFYMSFVQEPPKEVTDALDGVAKESRSGELQKRINNK